MKKKQKNNDDARYFYAVVFITISIAGVIVWQLFFAEDDYNALTDPSLENAPRVDFAFLDSYTFQDLDKFQKGDEPLLPWRQIRNPNPFRSPEIPKERELRNWWSVFNIELSIEDYEWKGIYPDLIKDESNPSLTFFENRWYEFKWNDLDGDNNFEIINEEGETVVNFEEDSDEDVLRFQATAAMSSYISNQQEAEGNINIIEEGEYEVIVNEDLEDSERDQNINDLLMKAGADLSDFYNRIRESEEYLEENMIAEANQAYSELETDFQELEELVNSGEVEEEEKIEQINTFRSEVSNLVNNFEDELNQRQDNSSEPSEESDKNNNEESQDEEDLEGNEESQDEEVQDEVQEETALHDEVKQTLETARDELSGFEEDIGRMEDEEDIEAAEEAYQELNSDLQSIEEGYYSGEVDGQTTMTSIEEFYEKAQRIIFEELDYYN